MRPNRRTRIIAALFALISVLYAQIAIAAYVCPAMQISQALATVQADSGATSAHMDMAGMAMDSNSASLTDHAMSGCDDSDPAQPVSCHTLGQDHNQSLDKTDAPPVVPFIASAIAQTVSPADLMLDAAGAAPAALPLTRTTAPPLAIRHCCFRI